MFYKNNGQFRPLKICETMMWKFAVFFKLYKRIQFKHSFHSAPPSDLKVSQNENSHFQIFARQCIVVISTYPYFPCYMSKNLQNLSFFLSLFFFFLFYFSSTYNYRYVLVCNYFCFSIKHNGDLYEVVWISQINW